MIERTIRKLKNIKSFINETKEYYHDGVDEELIDMINDILKELERFLKGGR